MSESQDKRKITSPVNGKLGGVKSEAGKSVSRFNAIKHGILSDVITDYETVNYKLLYDNLVSEFPPSNILEELIIERIAVAYIKLQRVSKAEAEQINAALNHEDSWVTNLDGGSNYKPEVSSEYFKDLSELYSRYETTTENRFYKAISKLSEFRNLRREQA